MAKTKFAALSGFSLLLALVSCGGNTGDGVRPKDLTAAGALGAAVTCTGEPKPARPLVIDLEPDARVDLEAAMKKGVVVVAYDCSSIRVLGHCNASDVAYEYAGTSRKEQVVQVKGFDELKANLPISAGKLSGEVQAGRSIDLGLVLVGKRSTLVSQIENASLKGTCDGATHFVQSATLGAFSMQTGSVGKVAAVADLFKVSASAKSESSRNTSSSDGSLEACRASNPDADAPPAECRAPLRIELVPITRPASAAPDAKVAAKETPKEKDKDDEKKKVRPDTNPCPPGFVWADGLCTSAAGSGAGGYLCEAEKPDECKAECAKGNAGSCYNYGAYAYLQDTADKEAVAAFKKACEGGHAEGCTAWGDRVRPQSNEMGPATLDRHKAAIEIEKRACMLGSAAGCGWLGSSLYNPNYKETTDLVGSLRAYTRGCALGEGASCTSVAKAYLWGKGTKPDPKKALDLYKRVCDSGSLDVCRDWAKEIHDGDWVPKELEHASTIMGPLCEKDVLNCGYASEFAFDAGHPDLGIKYATIACDKVDAFCDDLLTIYESGKRVKKDPAKVQAILTKVCTDDPPSKLADRCDAFKKTGKKGAPKAAKKPAPKKK